MLCCLSGKVALTYGNLARLLGKLQLFRVEVGFSLVLGFISGDMLALKVQFLPGDAKFLPNGEMLLPGGEMFLRGHETLLPGRKMFLPGSEK